MLSLYRDPPRPFLSEFTELQLLRQDGSTAPATEAFKGRRYVLIYFAAHWCPPCQRFTPHLADFYNAYHDAFSFDVLFVSSDREERRMMDFFQNRSSNYIIRRSKKEGAGADALTSSPNSPFPASASETLRQRSSRLPREPVSDGHGDWYALPFHEKKVSKRLVRRFKAYSIPRLIIVDQETGEVVSRNARDMVLQQPSGMGFPWRSPEESSGLGWWHVLAGFFLLLLLTAAWWWARRSP